MDMDEFLGIAIWVLMAFLIVNVSIIWVASQDGVTGTSLAIQGLTPDYTFSPTDVNTFKEGVKTTECVQGSAFDPSYSLCLIGQFTGSIVQSATGAVTFAGKASGLLWNLLFAWHTVLTAVLGNIGGGSLFIYIFTIIFGGVEVFALVVFFMKIAGIVRGGS